MDRKNRKPSAFWALSFVPSLLTLSLDTRRENCRYSSAVMFDRMASPCCCRFSQNTGVY